MQSISWWTLNSVLLLKNLVKFTLNGHTGCQRIMALNHLPYLQVLELLNSPAVAYISNSECDDNVNGNLLPSLQYAHLCGIPQLKGWWKDVVKTQNTISLLFFPCLYWLDICLCPNLIWMPLFPYVEELNLGGLKHKIIPTNINDEECETTNIRQSIILYFFCLASSLHFEVWNFCICWLFMNCIFF